MKSYHIRKKFLEFFQKRNHKILPSSDILLNNDPSLLFVNAGMNQFKDIFLGLKPPPVNNAVTIQKCLRVGGKHNDLEEVGSTPRHHTFFEMLGNFSFGDHFKEKAIELAWEFLTKELEISENYLWVTVHRADEESYALWKKHVPEDKIYKLEDKDNFWQMGETGPCGYCSEIHYYRGDKTLPQADDLIEIWNLVFMEFQNHKDGRREKLPHRFVDTGMGLERICAVLQDKSNNYHTDLFMEIIKELEKLSPYEYHFEKKNSSEKTVKSTQTEAIQKAFHVVADHSRAVSLLIAEGARPGNQKENYVLRRIIRRAFYYSQKLQPESKLLGRKSLLEIGTKKAIELMEEANKHLAKVSPLYEKHFDFSTEEKDLSFKNKALVAENLQRENKRFSESLKEGKKRLETVIQIQEKELTHSSHKKTNEVEGKTEKALKLDEQTVWNLYSTYGFPMDLTRLIAKERGLKSPTEKEMEFYIKQQEAEIKEKKGINPKNQLIHSKNFLEDYTSQFIHKTKKQKGNSFEKTTFTGYKQKTEIGNIIFMRTKDQDKESVVESIDSVSSVKKEQEAWLLLDKSCFYPEGGGAIGDKGWLKTETGTALVLDAQKTENFIWHKVKVKKGSVKINQQANLKVDEDFRQQIAISHSSTHLLNSALRKVLGESVSQAGSLVEPGRLRFDFTFPRSLSQKELSQIEKELYKSIGKEEVVSSSQKSFDEAIKGGALSLKGEDYGVNPVRVISMGEKTSKELCGGIHVTNTREIEHFKIVSEKGVQSGVRRIIAYTGAMALKWEKLLIEENRLLREFLQETFSFDVSDSYDVSGSSQASGSSYESSSSLPKRREIKLPSENQKKPKSHLTYQVQENEESSQHNPRDVTPKTQENPQKFSLTDFCRSLTQIQGSSFNKTRTEGVVLWQGWIGDPFIKILNHLELEIKKTKQNIVRWETQSKASLLESGKLIKTKSFFHPLAEQILHLREFLKLSLPKESPTDLFWNNKIEKELALKDSSFFENHEEPVKTQKSQELKKPSPFFENTQGTKNFYLFNDFFKEDFLKNTNQHPLHERFESKKQELKKLRTQWESLQAKGTKEELINKAKPFELKGLKAKLLVTSLPIEDRKLLAEILDSLMSCLPSGLCVLVGESTTKHAVLVAVSKDWQNLISAGNILKTTIAPLCKGQGGGKPSFAQGSITDLQAFQKLEPKLLETIGSSL